MSESENKFLGEEPVGSLMRKYAIPCIISLLVGALYNIVDQIFIATGAYRINLSKRAVRQNKGYEVCNPGV